MAEIENQKNDGEVKIIVQSFFNGVEVSWLGLINSGDACVKSLQHFVVFY